MSNLRWDVLNDLNEAMKSPGVMADAESGTPVPDANGDGQFSDTEIAALRTFWREEILRALKVRKQREKAWRASRRAYSVKQNRIYKSSINDGKDTAEEFTDPVKVPFRVSNAIHYSNVEIITSNIMANEPVIKVDDDLDPTSIALALQRLIQSKMSYFLKHIKISRTLMKEIYDLANFNITICKAGYSYGGTHMESAPANSAFAVRIDPFQFLVDAEAADKDSARWEAEEYYIDERELDKGDYMRVEDAKRYLNKYLINPEGNNEEEKRIGPTEAKAGNTESEINLSLDGKVEPASIRRLHVVDIYDKINRKIITAVLQNYEVVVIIKVADIPKYIKSTPYKVCVWNIVPGNFYGITDFEVIESKLREIDKIEQRILDYTKTMIPKYLFDKMGISKDELEDLIRGEMLACVGVKVNAVPLDKVIRPLIEAVIPRENFMALSDLRQQINADLGITDFMRGKSDSDTATEASIIDAASKTRSQKRQNLFDDFLDDVIKGVFAAMREMQFKTLWINEAGKYPVVSRNAEGKLGFEVDEVTGAVIYKYQPGFQLTKDMLLPFNITVERGSTSAKKGAIEKTTAVELYKVTKGDQFLNGHAMLRRLFLVFGWNPDELTVSPQEVAGQMGAAAGGMLPPPGPEGGPIPGSEAEIAAGILGGAANQAMPPMPPGSATSDIA